MSLLKNLPFCGDSIFYPPHGFGQKDTFRPGEQVQTPVGDGEIICKNGETAYKVSIPLGHGTTTYQLDERLMKPKA